MALDGQVLGGWCVCLGEYSHGHGQVPPVLLLAIGVPLKRHTLSAGIRDERFQAVQGHMALWHNLI